MGKIGVVVLSVLAGMAFCVSAYHNRVVVFKDPSFGSPAVKEGQKVVFADCVFSNIDVYLVIATWS